MILANDVLEVLMPPSRWVFVTVVTTLSLMLVLAACLSQQFTSSERAPFTFFNQPPVLSPTAATTAFPEIVVPTDPSRPIPRGLAPVPTPTPRPWVETDNYLILGIDQRPGDKDWRTDTILLAAVDWHGRRVGMVSIPRDLLVEIPGVGETRINRADYIGESSKYPGGGPALLRRVLTQTLGLNFQHYVRINMQQFERIVDTLGGVTVTLPCTLYEAVPDSHSPTGLSEWILPAGENWLNGENARRFATFRYYSNDFDRARRQQMLLWALRDRALQINILPRLPELWMAFRDTIQTNLRLSEIIRLAQFALRLQPENVYGLTFDFSLVESVTTESGAYVLRLRDPEALRVWLDSVFERKPASASPLGKTTCPPRPTPRVLITPIPSEMDEITPTAVLTTAP
jgi:LCP family protein required for cell wall assembly